MLDLIHKDILTPHLPTLALLAGEQPEVFADYLTDGSVHGWLEVPIAEQKLDLLLLFARDEKVSWYSWELSDPDGAILMRLVLVNEASLPAVVRLSVQQHPLNVFHLQPGEYYAIGVDHIALGAGRLCVESDVPLHGQATVHRAADSFGMVHQTTFTLAFARLFPGHLTPAALGAWLGRVGDERAEQISDLFVLNVLRQQVGHLRRSPWRFTSRSNPTMIGVLYHGTESAAWLDLKRHVLAIFPELSRDGDLIEVTNAASGTARREFVRVRILPINFSRDVVLVGWERGGDSRQVTVRSPSLPQ